MKIKKNRESLILYLSLFFMASCGISYEYNFSKISSDLLGNSVRQWAIIIGLMMLFMGIGSDLQKYFNDKKLLDKFILFEILLGLIGGFGSIIMLYSFGSFRDHFILIQYLLIISVGLLIGLEIPLLSRINEKYTKSLKFNIGNVLKMDYIGSFAGALIWVFVLPKFFTLIEISFILGIVNVIVALGTLLYFNKDIYHKKSLLILIFMSFFGISYGFIESDDWAFFSEQKLFQDKIVFSRTTPYQHIILTESKSSDIFCYINGNLQFSSIDEFIYHEMLVHPAMLFSESKKRIQVLVLGGGDGLAVRELLKYKNVKDITLADLDPEMTKIASKNKYLTDLNKNSLINSKVMILKNNNLSELNNNKNNDISKDSIFIPNQNHFKNRLNSFVTQVNIINIDAYKFIEEISGVYDVIIIDFPDPNSLELSKLYSKGFYQRIYSKLSKNGIVVQQSTSPYHAKEVFLTIGRTMKAGGLTMAPYHENIPTFGEWGFWIGGRNIDFGNDNQLSLLDSLKNTDFNLSIDNRLKKRESQLRFLTSEVIKSSFIFAKDMLKTDNTSINTIVTDVIFEQYYNAWKKSE